MIISTARRETDLNFNTSHVTVYHYSIKLTISTSRNFNTSHVTVYQSLHLASRLLNWNFNTSHVTVYHISRTGLNLFKGISIHLMLRFITTAWSLTSRRRLISIHLMLRFIVSSLPLRGTTGLDSMCSHRSKCARTNSTTYQSTVTRVVTERWKL